MSREELEADLLEHGAWLRRLALSLVESPAQADDVLQETWIRRLSHPPARDRSLRPWLARVLTNTVRMGHRSDARRARREEAAATAPTEPVPTPEALVERVEQQRRLAGLILALDEPYRETLLLRYVEDLTPSEIARRQGIRPGTVRWRLKAGLDRVRGALAPTPAERKRILAPLAAPLVLKGAVVMSRKSLAGLVALLVLLLLASGAFFHFRHGTGGATAPGRSGKHPRLAASAAHRTPGPRKTAAARGRRAPALQKRLAPIDAVARRQPGARTGVFAGRVVNWSTGKGVAEAELTFSHDGVADTVLTRTDGTFRFVPSRAGDYLLAGITKQGYLPFAPDWDTSPVILTARPGVLLGEIVLFLRPAVDYHGLVLAPSGKAVAGARVRLLPRGQSEDDLVPLRAEYTSGKDGRFLFHAPDGALLEARHPSFGPGRATLDGNAQVSHHLSIHLGPPGSGSELGGRKITGHVVDAGGDPVPGAQVRATSSGQSAEPHVLADDAGRFVLGGLDPGDYTLVARQPGMAPSRRQSVHAGDDITLVLGAGAALEGRVTGPDGDPAVAFTVVVLAPRGLARVRVAAQTFLDGQGTFRFDALPPGSYEVVAAAAGTGPSDEVETRVPRSEPLELRLHRGATVSGRVVDRETGAPLPRARVNLEGGVGEAASALPLATALTDESGAFALTGVPAGERSVLAAAGGHNPRIVGGLEAADGAELGPLVIDLAPTAKGDQPHLELVGIGAILKAGADGLLVDGVINGGGAAESGIAKGDVILAVDGVNTTELGFEESIQRIRGVEGTEVRLTLRLPDGTQVDRLVVRRRIQA